MDFRWEHYVEKTVEHGIEYGAKILVSIAIFLIGRWIASKIVSLIKKGMGKAKVDPTLISFAGHTIYIALVIVALVAAASNMGIDTTSFIAIFGAAGLAVGLALKDTLSNVGAAVLIIFFRPFKVKDFIEASGVQGTVQSINLFSTTLNTVDNRSIVIPNGALIGGNIINYTSNDQRRIDLVFDIDYKDDLKLAKNVIMEILQAHPKVLKDPTPVVVVGALGNNSVQLFARPWVETADYWDMMFELTEQVKLTFDRHGISIPFPQMDLHLKNGALQ